MKYNQLLSALIVLTSVTGCGSSSTEEQATTPSATNAPVQASDTASKNPVGNSSAPVSSGTNIQVSPTPVQNQDQGKLLTIPANLNKKGLPVNSTTSTAAGLNPAHGQPGHRCDISVGAPLNSKPNQPVVTNPQPQVVTPTQPASAQPIVTAPGMNPQHGQPGHRCDIAVGAPLNSKPAQ